MNTEPKNEKITNKSDDSEMTNNDNENKSNKKSNSPDPQQSEKNKSLEDQARDIHPQTPAMEKNIQQQKSRDNM